MIQRLRWALIAFLVILVVAQLFRSLEERRRAVWVTDSLSARFFRPVGSAYRSVSDFITEAFNRYLFLSEVEKKNEALNFEIERIKIENAALHERLAVLGEWRGVLATYGVSEKRLLPTRILSEDLFPTSKSVLIDCGSLEGVRVNNVVLTGEGLVGRVLQTFDHTSKVLLLTDPHFSVDAMSVRTGARILVSGVEGLSLAADRSPFLTQIEFLENAREIKSGDALVTSGLGGIFPQGIPIGLVDSVNYSEKNLFDSATVLPATDFAKLVRVFVLLGPNALQPMSDEDAKLRKQGP